MSDSDNIRAALAAGEELGTLKAAAEVHYAPDVAAAPHGGVPFLLKREGFTLHSVEAYLERPVMIRAVVKVDDATSFVNYVNRFKDGDSIVFANLVGRSFEAVIDYHEEGEIGNGARWGRHRSTFACTTTSEWATWTAQNKQAVPQVDFARFIEEHLPNIAEPAGADLLEMCLTLEAKKDASFRSSVRLADGRTQFRYEEEIEGRAGATTGNVAIPSKFTLLLEPFQGVGLKALEARFRYRIHEGTLKLWYELVRPDDVLRAAFDTIVADIRTAVGPTLVLAGAAPEIK